MAEAVTGPLERLPLAREEAIRLREDMGKTNLARMKHG